MSGLAARAPDPARDALLAEWERCKGWIEAALEHDGGHYGVEDVLGEVLTGSAQFWPGRQSAVVTQFWNFPRARCCNYWLAGGDMDELLSDMQPVIEQWAALQGCTEIIVAGRKGWERAMRSHGFSPVWTALRKHIGFATSGRC